MHMHIQSHTQALAETNKDASMKTLTISGNPEPILKLALGFETLTGKFNQNKHRMYSQKIHVCCSLLASSFVVEFINNMSKPNTCSVMFLCYVQH